MGIHLRWWSRFDERGAGLLVLSALVFPHNRELSSKSLRFAFFCNNSNSTYRVKWWSEIGVNQGLNKSQKNDICNVLSVTEKIYFLVCLCGLFSVHHRNPTWTWTCVKILLTRISRVRVGVDIRVRVMWSRQTGWNSRQKHVIWLADGSAKVGGYIGSGMLTCFNLKIWQTLYCTMQWVCMRVRST